MIADPSNRTLQSQVPRRERAWSARGVFWLVPSVLVAILFLAAALPSPPVLAVKGNPRARAIVRSSFKHDVSPALRSIPPKQPPPGPLREIPLHRRSKPQASTIISPELQGVDPVVQNTPPPVNIPAPLLSFEGVGNVNSVLPPDPNGDVGPNHYVQWVNLSFAVFSKTGTLLFGPAAGNTLWSGFGAPCETTNNGDPIVQYDQLADRWLMSQFALPNFPAGPFFQCIAISQTGDPTGAFNRYAFLISDTKLNDYCKFGVWPDAYYMTANQFTCSLFTCVFAGQGAVAFERDQMLAGLPANLVYFDLFGVDPTLGGMLPSDLDGTTPPPLGSPNFFVEVDNPPPTLQVFEFHVDWTDPTLSTFTGTAMLPVDAFNPNLCDFRRNCIPQPGTSVGLDAISDRLMYRLAYRNFGDHESLVTNHTVNADPIPGNHAGIRWYELRKDAVSNWSIAQQGTYAPDDDHRWMGSIAMDRSGNIALGFSVSGMTTFPSIRYAGRLAGDPLGTLPQGEANLIIGSGSQTHPSDRWGDYSALAVDPTDDCTFWYTQEYYAATSAAGWQTRIGSFRFPNCGL